jgi:hypothetical protein
VRFKNIGGRTWTTGNDPYGRGRIFLAATNGAGTATRNSSFQASDWSNAWLVSPPDLDGTGPDENISFTFGLYAAPPQGVYIENFNLRANALWWFDYDTLGDYYIPIHVYNKPPG